MSEESPPTYTTSIFNQANFGTTDEGLDTAYLNSHYLRYPTAQTGLETIANLATTNNATINGLTVGKGNLSNGTSTAFGVSALNANNNTSADNTAIGYQALLVNTFGTSNTAIGGRALIANTFGDGCIAVGYNSLVSNTTGDNNTAIGGSALQTNITSSNNTAVGVQALFSITTGNQTAVGYQAAKFATGSSNLAIGYRALSGSVSTNTGGFNIAIGEDVMLVNTTGYNNTAIGYNSLKANTIGNSNIAVGFNSLSSNLNGANHIAIGSNALSKITTNSNSVAIGFSAVSNNTGSSNTGVGHAALSGTLNTSNGGSNTAVGSDALGSLTTGTNNVAVGYQAGYAGTANTSGSNNTFIGYQAQANANNFSNSTALGVGAIITASNQIMIGRSTEKVYIYGGLVALPYVVGIGSQVLTATAGTGRVALAGTFTLPSGYNFLLPIISNGDSAANGANLTLTGATNNSTVFVVFNNAIADAFRANYIIYAIV